MTTLLQEIEVRQQKLAQLTQLIKELGLENLVVPQGTSLMATAEPTVKKKYSEEARKRISEAKKRHWAKLKAEGKLLNPKQKPKQPLVAEASSEK